MTKNSLKWIALLGSMTLGATSLMHAQDSGALINMLVKKGIINDQEAEDLRSDLTKEFANNTSAGKLNLSSSLAELKFSGDIRLRHQMETQANAVASGSPLTTDERTRERFRLRFNVDATLQKGWTTGFALETGQASDSGNQTFQGGADDYGVYIARAYIGYQYDNKLSFVAGKQKNPLYTTDLVWDADINPQGLTEIYKYSFGGKDTLEFRAHQSIMEDNKESVVGPKGNDAWLFAQQLVYTKYFGKNSLVLAPGYTRYNQSTIAVATNENPFNGSTAHQEYALFAGEFNVAEVAGEGTALKLYWDSSYNFQAGNRVYGTYGLTALKADKSRKWDKDPLAWLVGVSYAKGTGKVQGDYTLKVDYRQIGVGAVDPNTSDSDFAFGKLNQQGFKSSVSYNVTDFASANLTYFYTTAIQKNLIDTNKIANLDHSQILQADVVVKF